MHDIGNVNSDDLTPSINNNVHTEIKSDDQVKVSSAFHNLEVKKESKTEPDVDKNDNPPSDDNKDESQPNTSDQEAVNQDKPEPLKKNSDKQHPAHEEHVQSDDKSNFNNLLIKHKPNVAGD